MVPTPFGQRGAAAEELWQAFVVGTGDLATVERWFYRVFTTSTDADAAFDGAARVRRGETRATWSLLWSLQAGGVPQPSKGSLSIVEDGQGRAVAVVRATEVRTVPYRDVSAGLVHELGEENQSLKSWRRDAWQRAVDELGRIGREPDLAMPILWERFRRVWPEP